MNRYKNLLDQINLNQKKIIGIFPFNTLIDKKSSNVYVGNLNFLESAIDGLKLLSKNNFEIVLFVNQFKSKQLSTESFQSMIVSIESHLKNRGVTILGIYWCPAISSSDPFVTPNPGMFHRVTEHHYTNWNSVPVISTSDNDLHAAEKVSACPIKIGSGPSKWDHFESLSAYVSKCGLAE